MKHFTLFTYNAKLFFLVKCTFKMLVNMKSSVLKGMCTCLHLESCVTYDKKWYNL